LSLSTSHSTADAVALLYSITSRASFEHLEHFWQVAKMAKSKGDHVIMVIGNKCDRDQEREVLKEEGEELAGRFGGRFSEVSAKTGQNAERMLSNLVRSLRKARPTTSSADGGLQKQLERKKKKCVTL
jgi:GTPase KRas protein